MTPPSGSSGSTGPTGPSGDEPDQERRAAALAHVREILHLHGATDEEIDKALADDVLDLFVFDRVLVPSRKRYTRREVAELTGVNHETLLRFWRALGIFCERYGVPGAGTAGS